MSLASSDDWAKSLTPLERRQWDSLATGMDRFHAHFRHDYNRIYEYADHYEKLGMNLEDYLDYAQSLHNYLHTHHNIEETYIFPVLAERMPEFQGSLPEQHREIHAGLDKYSEALTSFRKDPSSYSPPKLRETMDAFREVLFMHLDAEVESLKGQNMRKYWSLEELRRIPF